MKIYIENLTEGQVTYAELRKVIKAINYQVDKDFEPLWSMGAGISYRKGSTDINKATDAIIYLYKTIDVDGALGYHTRNDYGIPWGVVATDIAVQLGQHWSWTLSHEVLELIADPMVNLTAIGPHPRQNRRVFHWYEMCDAVQNDSYEIEGVKVSDFVTPLYFTEEAEVGERTRFLTTRPALKSFGVASGGYIGFFDPTINKDTTHAMDAKAKERMKIRNKLGVLRRNNRYHCNLVESPAKMADRIMKGKEK